MVKEIVDTLRDAEIRAEKLVNEAESRALQNAAQFQKERERRIRNVRAKNEEMKEKSITDAETRAKREETAILGDAQRVVNELSARADKKKEEAILLIIRKILEQ